MLNRNQFEYRITQTLSDDMFKLLEKLKPEKGIASYELLCDSIFEDIASLDMKLAKIGFLNRVAQGQNVEQEKAIKSLFDSLGEAFEKVDEVFKKIKI
jgi:hypothetical protein